MHVLIWQPSDRDYIKHIVLPARLPVKTQKLHFRESTQQRNIIYIADEYVRASNQKLT